MASSGSSSSWPLSPAHSSTDPPARCRCSWSCMASGWRSRSSWPWPRSPRWSSTTWGGAMPPEQPGPLKNQVRRLRFERGEMTQQELAKRVGVTRQTIIALEAGKYTPSLLLAFRLARAFGVGVEEVFRYEEGDGAAARESG